MTGRYDRVLLRGGVAAAVVLYLLLTGLLARARSPFSDEAVLFSPALNLITQGHMGTTVLDESSTWRDGMSLKGINRYTYQVMPMHFLFQAAWYKVLGAGLFQMRALSILWGLAALGAWFVIAWSLSQNMALSVVTLCLLAVDNTFLVSSGFGRADMTSASLGFMALAAYLLLRKRKLTVAVIVSHSLAAASVFTHPVGALHLFNLLFLTVYFDRRRISFRHFAAAAAPYTVFTAGWGVYIAQNPAVFWEQFRSNAGGRFFMHAPWRMIGDELGMRYLPEFGFGRDASPVSRLKLYLLLAFGTALAVALTARPLRRHPGFRALLAMNGIAFVAMTFLEGTKQAFYLAHLIPLHSAVLAVCLWWVWTERKLPRWAILVLASLLLSLQFARTAHVLKMDTYRTQYLPAVRFLEKDVQSGKLIVGDAILAFGLGFTKTVIEDLRLGYYTHKTADTIVVNDRYKEWFVRLRRREPDVYAYVSTLLSTRYERVYDTEAFTIYRLRGSNEETGAGGSSPIAPSREPK